MITTTEIQETVKHDEGEINIANAARHLDLGVHALAMSDTVIALDNPHIAQLEAIMRESLAHFPEEQTRVQQMLGLPTAIARVDCTIGADGILPYECDERPAGLGVLNLMQKLHSGQGIEDHVQNHIIAATGSELVAVHHREASPNDDHAVMEVAPGTAQLNGHSVLVRGEPHMFMDDEPYDALAARSISTIRTEGSKSYTLHTSSFDTRVIREAAELPGRDESFVIKMLRGSKAKGVALHLSPSDRKRFGKNGNVTHTKAQNIVTGVGAPLLVESFRAPIRSTHGNLILRVIGLVDADKVEIIGGSFVARPETLVHGASNAIAGLVMAREVQK